MALKEQIIYNLLRGQQSEARRFYQEPFFSYLLSSQCTINQKHDFKVYLPDLNLDHHS